jgi:hypothetical protein
VVASIAAPLWSVTGPLAVFSADGGIQAVVCAAPTAGAGGTTFTCTGTIAGNALQGSTVALCFTATAPCLLGTVSGQALAAPPPLLPPVPFLPPPLSPPPLLPPVGPPALGPAPEAGVPVIPEADSVVLLLAGLTALGILARRRLLRRR